MTDPSTALPLVILRQMILWADCPAKVFWERHYRTIRYDHDYLLRFLLIRTLEGAYARLREEDKPEIAKYGARIWPWFLSQKGVPRHTELIELMDRYAIMRRFIISQVRKTNEQLQIANIPPMAWWQSPQCSGEYLRVRDEINQYQGLIGMFKPDSCRYQSFQQRLPNTLADVYADFLDAVDCLSKSPVSPRFSPEINPIVDLHLSSVSIRMSFDAVWYRPWTNDNPNRARKTDRPETIAEYFIFGSDFNSMKEAVSALRLTNDYRLPCISKKLKSRLQPRYVGAGKNNSSREYCFDSVRYRYFFTGESSRAFEEDTPNINFENLEFFANRYLEARSGNAFVPGNITLNSKCTCCVYQKDCSSENPLAFLAVVSRQQEAADAEFINDFSDRILLSANPDEALEIARASVSILKNNPEMKYDMILNVIDNLKADLAKERKEGTYA